MCFDFPFSKFTEIDEGDVACFDAGSCENEVVLWAGKGDKVVDLIFFEFKGLDDVFDFETEEIDEKDFVVEGYHNLV